MKRGSCCRRLQKISSLIVRSSYKGQGGKLIAPIKSVISHVVRVCGGTCSMFGHVNDSDVAVVEKTSTFFLPNMLSTTAQRGKESINLAFLLLIHLLLLLLLELLRLRLLRTLQSGKKEWLQCFRRSTNSDDCKQPMRCWKRHLTQRFF